MPPSYPDPLDPPESDAPAERAAVPLEADLGLAITAAQINDDLETAQAEQVPPRYAYTRTHVEELRQAGATRDQAKDYAAQFFTPAQVELLASDFDTYGEWADD